MYQVPPFLDKELKADTNVYVKVSYYVTFTIGQLLYSNPHVCTDTQATLIIIFVHVISNIQKKVVYNHLLVFNHLKK